MFLDSNLETVRLEWARKLRDALKSTDRSGALMAVADEIAKDRLCDRFQVVVIRNAAKSVGSVSEGSAMDGVRQIIGHFEYLKRRGERVSALMSDESRKANSEPQEPRATQERNWTTVTKDDTQTGDAL